jgi:hypothetical protein
MTSATDLPDVAAAVAGDPRVILVDVYARRCQLVYHNERSTAGR